MTKDTSAQAIKFYNKIKTMCIHGSRSKFNLKISGKDYNFEQVMRVKTGLAE